MHQFQISPLQRFASEGHDTAAIRRPRVEEIAHFSYDEEHKLHLDDQSLKYYYTPNIGADLSRAALSCVCHCRHKKAIDISVGQLTCQATLSYIPKHMISTLARCCVQRDQELILQSGFESFRKLDDTGDDHLESLLACLANLEKQSGGPVSTDIITWRGMMTKIMSAPFDNFNEFEMNATKFQDTIFIEENHAHKLQSRDAQHSQSMGKGAPSQDMMSYWGYKFETLSVLPSQWSATPRDVIEGREEAVVDNHAQYCSVVKTGIGKTRLVLGGEVDAIWDCRPERTDRSINWVELKTSAEIRNAQDEKKFQRKLLKFWIQSFLLGVPKVIVGFRTSAGILREVREFETQGIPTAVKRGSNLWDGNICINFTAAFLEWLREILVADGVWRIRRRPKAQVIEVFQVEQGGHGEVISQDFMRWRSSAPRPVDQSEAGT